MHLTAPPVDGAANTALVALLAQCLAVPKRDIEIVRGATGRSKVIEISGISAEDVEKRIKSFALNIYRHRPGSMAAQKSE